MLLLILFLSLIVLIVVLWGGTYFFQGYIYTEPSSGIFWQAPLAAGFLMFGYLIWVMTIALSSPANPSSLSTNPILFSPNVDMLKRPAKRITAIKLNHKKSVEGKDGEKVVYVIKTGARTSQYMTTVGIPHPWHSNDVIAIEFETDDGTTMRFDLQEIKTGGYREFASADGWVMREYESGPTGLPIKFSFWRLIVNVFFNVGHFIGWFLAFWVILRFQWSHSLGFAVVMWLVISLTFLPMILGYAAEVAARPTVAAIALGKLVFV
jgi:hypothetical protein